MLEFRTLEAGEIDVRIVCFASRWASASFCLACAAAASRSALALASACVTVWIASNAMFSPPFAFTKWGYLLPYYCSKYFKKGMMISLIGRLRVSGYKDKNGDKRISTDVIVEETYFAESKKAFESGQAGSGNTGDTFYKAENVSDDDLPF